MPKKFLRLLLFILLCNFYNINTLYSIEIFNIKEITSDSIPNPDSIYSTADVLPYLSVCDTASTEASRKKCSDIQMLLTMQHNLRYPREAYTNGVSGKVVVKFVIDEKGQMTDLAVAKGIGGGCDEEALRVVSLMQNWTAGKKNGTPVKVRMFFPIKFAVAVFNSYEQLPKEVRNKLKGSPVH